MAAADAFEIIVKGTSGAWVLAMARRRSDRVGAQIVSALQTIVSRNVDITRCPRSSSVGQFQSGVRNNIIPDSAGWSARSGRSTTKCRRIFTRACARSLKGLRRVRERRSAVTIDRGYPVTSNDAA